MENIEGIEVGPAIVVIDNAINFSSEIIKKSNEESYDWKNAEIISNDGSVIVNKNHRETNIHFTNKDDVFWKEVYNIVFNYADQYAKIFDFSFSSMEDLQLLHYKAGYGKYEIHIDDSPKVPRVMSSILYLNTVSSGGETYFDKFDISISPIENRLVMFPANYAYSHAAIKPESEDKFAIVTWFKPLYIEGVNI